MKHLLLVVRRSELCRSGCLGWCTLWVTLDFMNWTVAALAEGVMPRTRHDGTPWTMEDGDRLQRAGKPSIRGVVTKVKGVWTKIVHTLGLQSWSHLFHPCFKCHSGRPRRDRRCKSGIAPVRCDDCDDACAICFIRPEDARTSHRHVEE